MSGMSAVNLAAASTVSNGDPELMQTIAEGLQLIHVLQVYTSSMMTLAVWDWLVCIRVEWKQIWKRQWSLIKGLYIWTRYYGIACFALNLWLFNAEFTIEQCKTLHYLIVATCMWATLGSEAILAVRTYAFLGRQLWVGAMLSIMLLAETAFLLYVAIVAVYQIPLLIGDRGPCTTSDLPGKHVLSGFWLAPVAFDLICTVMIILQVAPFFTSVGGILSTIIQQALRLRVGRTEIRSNIVNIFVREGIFYFIAVSSVNLLNAAFMIQSSQPNLQNINSYLALILSQVLCCRLVLGLRGQCHDGPTSTTYTASESQPVFTSSRTANFNIPLRKYGPSVINTHGHDDDRGGILLNGVKVQIDVEREAGKSLIH
ncbi:hypothetical protein AGABI2DRAFT_115245 [Agaricus bisporus var. bisporus H97]|uniref:hypothetical protein n=1 Tax=Agaricus bisporus var. bisporus (strain H97 / ATCC MYA-4626 / FGSC 10389) TaxID=936046 RepID=UPI00029F73D3|nr:hypothetical protein AGABI2DRAFT_115245 [Agaricus bisporus var. bisporus H97]EKV50190.1 hypothetical protein AGABI2DRAFT_115245 [Agaricus bisporus var. bisporus H97]